MADVKPSPEKVRKRKLMEVASLRATMARQEYELIEMEERMAANRENIAASLKKVEELEEELKGI